jgi:hypothetical protein
MNVTLTVGDVVLMGSDVPPENFDRPQGFDVNLEFDNIDFKKEKFMPTNKMLAFAGSARKDSFNKKLDTLT